MGKIGNMDSSLERREFLVFTCGGLAALQVPDACRAQNAAAAPTVAPTLSPRRRLSMDNSWRFIASDLPFPAIAGHEASYAHAKAGNAEGAAAVDYDDSDWATVDLPHDFALGQPFDPAANLSQGFRTRGIGWYRRTFALDPGDQGRHFELRFDGIATFATIWLNGNLVHRNFCGYTGFTIDLTPFARFGEDLNTLVVRADAQAQEGWWYEGAGIYRHVWLTIREPVHIATDGIHADPRRNPDGTWHVPVHVDIDNSGASIGLASVDAMLMAPDGGAVARGQTSAEVGALDRAIASLDLPVVAPQLWSVTVPALYTLRLTLRHGGAVVDAVDTAIGFRTVRFDADRGFFLNDQPLKLKGVCAHQDVGGVGVAVPDSLWDFRLRRLKDMGANALRSAHNPPAAELLDAADRLGLLVIDENRNFNVSEDYLPQLEWMVRRDRNHPSVIVWSVCNEESIQGTEQGVQMVRRMVHAVKALDPVRPVTAAMNSGMFATENISQVVDVVGFNYQTGDYDRFHAENPQRPLFSSEDTSAYMTRGEFATDPARHVLSSYDVEHAAWGASHRQAWQAIATRPFVAGGFAWTGFDYRGEPTPFDWPTVGASFGAMDLCGFAKTAFYIRQALWIADRPILALAPHWTWPGREGQPIEVMAITNAERVVLRLNGHQVADLTVDPFMMARCTVAYAPGRLEAVAWRAGRIVAHTVVETAGPPVRLGLVPDRPVLAGDGRDAQPVTVLALDARGRAVPTAQTLVDFAVTGGRIIGLGNGDPNSHESDVPDANGAMRRLYNGLAQVIVQSDRGRAGVLTLHAVSPGMIAATAEITVNRSVLPPLVAPAPSVQTLTEWRQSPATPDRPDPMIKLADNDMNSWGWTKPGAAQRPVPSGRYTLMRVAFTPRNAVQRRGGQVVFSSLAGLAEVWLDDRRVAVKADGGIGRLAIVLPAGKGTHTLTVLFDAPLGGPPFGISGGVSVEPTG
jgi:beta-galactosidase